jgi:hypothetical protein
VAERYYTTSTAFLEALAEAGVRHVQIHLDTAAVEVRRVVTARAHDDEWAERAGRERPRSDGAITAGYLTVCLRRLLEDENALILTEVVTNSKVVATARGAALLPSRPVVVHARRR